METVLIAIGTLVPLLIILVVIHEFGHFATARAMGVKVLEFGDGFPPRAFGFYTGNTPVLIDGATRFVGLSASDLSRGQKVKVSSTENAQGNLVEPLRAPRCLVCSTPSQQRSRLRRLPRPAWLSLATTVCSPRSG